MKRKVVICGLGHVGSHVMQMLALRGVADEIVGIEYRKDKQFGEVRDMNDAMSYLYRQCVVKEGTYEDLEDAAVMVITVSGIVYDDDRLKELDGSVEIIDTILKEVRNHHFKGTIVVLSNPCDLVAYYVDRNTDNVVIGTGTALDSARLRAHVGEALGIAPASVEGYCIGEHGDSQVICWSQTRVAGKRADEMLSEECVREVEKKVTTSGFVVATAKGSTEYGIACTTCDIIQSILCNEKRVFSVSVDPAGYLGQTGCFAGIPCVISAEGAKPLPAAELSEDEKERFVKSCSMLREIIEKKWGLLPG